MFAELMFKQDNFFAELTLFNLFIRDCGDRVQKQKVSCLFQMKKVQARNETMLKTQSNKNLGNTEERIGNWQQGNSMKRKGLKKSYSY